MTTDNEDWESHFQYPTYLDLVFSTSGCLARIDAQTRHIRKLITKVYYRQMPLMLCWVGAYPYLSTNTLRRSLMNAAHYLGFESIQDRIKSEETYANDLAQTVRDAAPVCIILPYIFLAI